MKQIRIHGRGGQGAVTAAELLAQAAFSEGKFVQAFPNFGVERRGAPVKAFVRISGKEILARDQVYFPDYLIIQDETLLLNDSEVLQGTEKTEMIIINCETSDLPKAVCVPATKIALEEIGKPFINTPMLGAFASATGLIKSKSLEKVFASRFKGEILQKNIKAMNRAYDYVKSLNL